MFSVPTLKTHISTALMTWSSKRGCINTNILLIITLCFYSWAIAAVYLINTVIIIRFYHHQSVFTNWTWVHTCGSSQLSFPTIIIFHEDSYSHYLNKSILLNWQLYITPIIAIYFRWSIAANLPLNTVIIVMESIYKQKQWTHPYGSSQFPFPTIIIFHEEPY